MREQVPVTQTLKITDVKNELSRLVTAVTRNETRVLVEMAGIPVAALVSIEDLKLLDRLDREPPERERRFAVVVRMRKTFRDVPPEEIERETARAVAKVRAERRAERERAEAVATGAV